MNKRIWSFAPLLVIYIVLIVVFDGPIKGDGFRYITYAENITNGFFTESDNPDLSNGPAYPLVLAPFVALNIDLLAAKLLNGLFVFVGILFFHRTLCYYTKSKYSFFVAMILGLYPPLLFWMTRLLTDAFAFMLVNGFIFYFCSAFRTTKKNWTTYTFASLCLGILILTKIVFFQVLLVGSLCLGLFILFKKKYKLRFTIYILFGAFLITLPYIVYAYSLTNKPFYLGTRGGELLYHRSTPFEGEYGNWISNTVILGTDNSDVSEISSEDLMKLRANHKEYYLQLEPLSNIQKDSAFKAKAIENMKKFPLKYVENTAANFGRLLFNYPLSYRTQSLSSYVYFIFNGLLAILFIFSAYYMFLSWKGIPMEIKLILFFALVYGGGITLLHGKPRYFIMMVPSILLSITYVFSNVIYITLRKSNIKS